MSKYPDSTETIESLCRSSGFDFIELRKIRGGVYKGVLRDRQLEGSSTAFVKIFSSSKYQRLKSFPDIAPDAGHPECYLVDDQYTCLIMGVVDGRPLSQLLPLIFLPGLWKFQKNRYRQVYFKIGEQIGRLHSATQNGLGPVLSERAQKKTLRRMEHLSDYFSRSTAERITALIQSASSRKTNHALTYGDRAPHNIFFDGDTVSQIDYGAKAKSTINDHASLIFGLRLMQKRLPYVRSIDEYGLEESYWDGYEQSAKISVPDSETVAIGLLYGYIDLLNFYQSDVYTLNAKLTKWVDPPKICEEINRIVEEVS